MLPLRDDIPATRIPVVTFGIIALNISAFLYQLGLGERIDVFLLEYAVVPGRYTIPEISKLFSLPEQALAFFTSIFLHGGWLHLLGNMWSLWIFGDNVEDRLGHGRYLALYLASGLAASFLHIFTNPLSVIPTIGGKRCHSRSDGCLLSILPYGACRDHHSPVLSGSHVCFSCCGVSGMVVFCARAQRRHKSGCAPGRCGRSGLVGTRGWVLIRAVGLPFGQAITTQNSHIRAPTLPA